jgi:hypothetical protein
VPDEHLDVRICLLITYIISFIMLWYYVASFTVLQNSGLSSWEGIIVIQLVTLYVSIFMI